LIYKHGGSEGFGDLRSQKPWSVNIEKETKENTNWRKVLNTSNNLQVVLMSVPPNQELGNEVHKENDQFFRFESGVGIVRTPINEFQVSDGLSVIIPQGVYHNVINTSKTEPLKFYTIYGPPHHKPNVLDITHQDEKYRESISP
jgi:mannose-6-phosphate isomerase-like protein (cupin superfamily)